MAAECQRPADAVPEVQPVEHALLQRIVGLDEQIEDPISHQHPAQSLAPDPAVRVRFVKGVLDKTLDIPHLNR